MNIFEQIDAIQKLSERELLTQIALPVIKEQIAVNTAHYEDPQTEPMGLRDLHETIEVLKAAEKRIKEL